MDFEKVLLYYNLYQKDSMNSHHCEIYYNMILTIVYDVQYNNIKTNIS